MTTLILWQVRAWHRHCKWTYLVQQNGLGFSRALTTFLLWLTARQRTLLIFHRYLVAGSRRRIFLTSGSPFSNVTTSLSKFKNFHCTRSVLNNFPHPETSNQLVVLGHDTATLQEIQVFNVTWKIIRKNTSFFLSDMITGNRSTLGYCMTTIRTNINIQIQSSSLRLFCPSCNRYKLENTTFQKQAVSLLQTSSAYPVGPLRSSYSQLLGTTGTLKSVEGCW